MHDQLLIYFSDHQIFTLMMTFFNLLLPINFLNPHTYLHDDFLSDSDKGRDNWNGSNARMATRDGDLWRLRHRARQSRGGDRADDGQNAPVTSWFFCHLVLRRLWVSPFLSLDLLLADVDRRGGLPSPSASTTQTPLPADQWPSGCECGVRTKCGGMAKSVAFHGTTQKVAHCYHQDKDMRCEAQKTWGWQNLLDCSRKLKLSSCRHPIATCLLFAVSHQS